MGYHDHGVVKIDQEILQPADRFQIQVVGRLVKQENVRITKKCLCQKDFNLLIGRQLAHHHRMCLGRYAKSVQESSSIGFRFPSIHGRKFLLKLSGTDTVLIAEIRFCVDCILFLHDLVKTFISHDNGIQHRIRIILEVILLQERKTLSRCDNNITL